MIQVENYFARAIVFVPVDVYTPALFRNDLTSSDRDLMKSSCFTLLSRLLDILFFSITVFFALGSCN